MWNTYAFFCNYARLDRFDPNATPVPVAERPDLDRWILSDLQLLVRLARQEFERYNVMAFCLQAEQFVDDRLSNWYVRRNRRRFWKSGASADKQAAYQTLHTVLLTLSRLIAPVVPFLAEAMYQNLRAGAGPDSVHLCGYPEPDPALIDADLSADMEALLRLVSLGSAARNTVKIKVRQPLAEMRVQPGDDRDRRAVERFADQLADELNIKKITLHDPAAGPLLAAVVRPNPKVLGPRFGPRLKEVQSALAAADASARTPELQAGRPVERACPGGPVAREPADVAVALTAPDGWAGVVDRSTQVAVDARITEPLAREGMARDVVRQVQELRKKSGLEVEDRIALHLDAEAAPLRHAIDEHRAYIAGETLTAQWAATPLGDGASATVVKVDGHPLRIELKKSTGPAA